MEGALLGASGEVSELASMAPIGHPATKTAEGPSSYVLLTAVAVPLQS
jgi:hypothetical protein